MSADSLDLVVDLYIEADPSRVFNALTNKAIAMWWGRSYLENDDEATILQLEPKVGGKFWERWSHDPNSHDGALLGTVVAIKHPRLLRMQGTFGMYEGEIQGLASFQLAACKSGSDLYF